MEEVEVVEELWELVEEEVEEVPTGVRPQNQRGPSLAVHLNIVTEQFGWVEQREG